MSPERRLALRREQRRRYRKAHPDKVREAKRRTKARRRGVDVPVPPRKNPLMTPEQHLEKKNAYARAWYAKTRDSHRERRLAAGRGWRRRHPAPIKAALTQEERQERVRERRRISRHARKARQRGSAGRMSRGLRQRLFDLQKGQCVYCRQPLIKSHLDHIIPLALGGSGHDENYQLLCPPCNIRKGAKHPVQFANELGMLL